MDRAQEEAAPAAVPRDVFDEQAGIGELRGHFSTRQRSGIRIEPGADRLEGGVADQRGESRVGLHRAGETHGRVVAKVADGGASIATPGRDLRQSEYRARMSADDRIDRE